MTLRRGCCHRLPDGGKLRACLRERVTVGDPAEHVEWQTSARISIELGKTKRHPASMPNRKGESRGHDTHDRVRGVTEAHGPAEDICVGIELALPLLVADHQYGRCTGTLVVVQKRPPEERRHACQPKARRRDGGDPDQLHVPVLGNQVALVVAEGAQLRHRLHPISPLAEVERRRWVPDHHKSVAPLDRHAGVEEGADQREIAGAERDGDRHASDRDEREPWILREHAQPELDVEPRHFHKRPPLVSRALGQEQGRARLAYLRGVAEPLRRRVASRSGTHAACDVVAGPLLEMEAKLLVDFLLGILLHRPFLSLFSSREVGTNTQRESRWFPAVR